MRWFLRFFSIAFLFLKLSDGWSSSLPSSEDRNGPYNVPHEGGGAAVTREADEAIRDFQFERLERLIPLISVGPDRDYFAGVLANRGGRDDQATTMLSRALPILRVKEPERAAIALRSLAVSLFNLSRYEKSAQTNKELLNHFRQYLAIDQLNGVQSAIIAARLYQKAPEILVSSPATLELAVARNRDCGAIETNVVANGVSAQWFVDTGAGISVISDSFAKALRLKLSRASARIPGSTGAVNNMRMSMVKDITIGDAHLRNVVVAVIDDRNLNLRTSETTTYQIQAILGVDVLRRLGSRLSMTCDGHFLVNSSEKEQQGSARLFWFGIPLLQTQVEGREALYVLDTGAMKTVFWETYHRHFPNQFDSLKIPGTISGIGGSTKADWLFLPMAKLMIGTHAIEAPNVPVTPETGTEFDRLYGLIGLDVLCQYRTFIVDFADMRFELGEKLH